MTQSRKQRLTDDAKESGSAVLSFAASVALCVFVRETATRASQQVREQPEAALSRQLPC